MVLSIRRGGTIARISAALALPACLDQNPEFIEPPVSTGASDGATSTGAPVGGTTSTSATEPASTGAPTTSADTESTTTLGPTTGTTSTDTSTTGNPAGCGDGALDPGEECDDGADNGEDADCTPACTLAACGDGYIHADEDCEDGNADPADGCVECIIPNTCLEILELDPNATTGKHFIDPDEDGPDPLLPVFCDMMLEGGGWTLIERSPSFDPIGHGLHEDVPVNLDDPSMPRFRLPRLVMSNLMDLTSDAYIFCGGQDRLILADDWLFEGENYGPDCFSSVGMVTYKEARLKGVTLTNVSLCTGFLGLANGECLGAWRIDEYEQYQGCFLDDYPWLGQMALTSDGADVFAIDPQAIDTFQPQHDCHKPDAVRMIMLR